VQKLQIVVGTVTGTAQGVAEYLRKNLSAEWDIGLHEYPDLDDILEGPNQTLLFCVSNTGVGELPPSMRKVYVQLTEQKRDLTGHQYLLINFADSSFKTFGKSGETLENALSACGAYSLDERLTIDAMHERYPRKTALVWVKEMLTKHVVER
jgi:MioC protein